MVPLRTIKPKRWTSWVVAATGPSLTPEVVELCERARVLAVNDAYRLIPWADVLYACDARWWTLHEGCPDFHGEKWSSHSKGSDDKQAVAERYGLNLVAGKYEEGFSLDPNAIHYGGNSGFQAINLALLMGARRIVLVGFDMRTNGKRHFFGDHPAPLSNAVKFETLVPRYATAAKSLPPGVEILNATPRSALTCFRMVDLRDALLQECRDRTG